MLGFFFERSCRTRRRAVRRELWDRVATVRAPPLETAVMARIGEDGPALYCAYPLHETEHAFDRLALALSLVPVLGRARSRRRPSPPSATVNRSRGRPETRRPEGAQRTPRQLEPRPRTRCSSTVDRRLPADVTLEEFANRTFRAWKSAEGQGQRVVFFAFVDDRKMRIRVSVYGSAPSRTRARSRSRAGCVVPAFKKGDFSLAA